jgi:hypothetical protein
MEGMEKGEGRRWKVEGGRWRRVGKVREEKREGGEEKGREGRSRVQ